MSVNLVGTLPKKPQSAYQLFIKQKKEELKDTIDTKDLHKTAIAQWKEITDEEKQPFLKTNALMQIQYMYEIAQFQENNPHAYEAINDLNQITELYDLLEMNAEKKRQKSQKKRKSEKSEKSGKKRKSSKKRKSEKSEKSGKKRKSSKKRKQSSSNESKRPTKKSRKE